VDLVLDLHRDSRSARDSDAGLGLPRPLPSSTVPPRRRHRRCNRGDDERRRLAGTGFGARDQIVPGERERNDRRLIGRVSAEAEIADRLRAAASSASECEGGGVSQASPRARRLRDRSCVGVCGSARRRGCRRLRRRGLPARGRLSVVLEFKPGSG
jgi:hypothetical protein